MLRNLFWIVPCFASILVYDIAMGILQRNQSLKNQEIMKSGISESIRNDSLQLLNQDTLKINSNIDSLKEILKQYQK